jgi:hypothetical protein
MARDELALAVARIAAKWGALAEHGPVSPPNDSRFTVAIGTSPAGLSLPSEVRLVKAALLYGERVILYSPAASLLYLIEGLAYLGEDKQLGFMQDTMELLQPLTAPELARVIAQYRFLKSKRRREPY